jgi:hypothetical protein
LSQISLGDNIPTEKTLEKTSVLQKKVKVVLSLNSSTEDNLPVGTKSLYNEKMHKESIVKVNNAKDVKLKKSGSQKKNSHPGGTSNNLEQARGIAISKEEEQPQKHLESGTTDCVKSIHVSNSSSKIKKSVDVYQCHICNRTFPSGGKLNLHVPVHLNLSEFQCDKCSKKFRSKFSLR